MIIRELCLQYECRRHYTMLWPGTFIRPQSEDVFWGLCDISHFPIKAWTSQTKPSSTCGNRATGDLDVDAWIKTALWNPMMKEKLFITTHLNPQSLMDIRCKLAFPPLPLRFHLSHPERAPILKHKQERGNAAILVQFRHFYHTNSISGLFERKSI